MQHPLRTPRANEDDILRLEPDDTSSRPTRMMSPESYGRTARTSAPRKCPRCSYALDGLPGVTCPECGVRFDRSLPAADRKRNNRKLLLAEYGKAFAALGIALGVLALVMLIRGDIGVYPLLLLQYVVLVPIGFAVYFACCLMWIGFDQPLGITAVRLAAIYAVVDCVGVTLGLFLPGIVLLLVRAATSVGLMTKWLDLDLNDAILVSIATVLVNLAITLLVVHQLMQ